MKNTLDGCNYFFLLSHHLQAGCHAAILLKVIKGK